MNIIEVDLNELFDISRDILTSYGVPLEDSEIVINSLIDAEINGISSHGLLRLKSYTERIGSGVINVNPKIKVEKNLNNVLLLNGDNGLGQVVAQKAMQLCFEKLSASNSAITVLVHNSNHFGAAGFYTKQAAQRGYLSLVLSNAGPTMAPWGGTEALLGTNPLSAAFPSGKSDFMLDMATSVSAKGKIRAMKNANENIPTGWAIDENGKDTQNPDMALKGTMLPIGDHKGYGLSMLVDTLCAGLTGASLSYETVSVGDTKRNANIGHFFYMIKIDDLLPLGVFQEKMDNWFETIKSSNKRENFDNIYIPGEIEEKRKKDITNTINLNKGVYKEILRIAGKRNIF